MLRRIAPSPPTARCLSSATDRCSVSRARSSLAASPLHFNSGEGFGPSTASLGISCVDSSQAASCPQPAALARHLGGPRPRHLSSPADSVPPHSRVGLLLPPLRLHLCAAAAPPVTSPQLEALALMPDPSLLALAHVRWRDSPPPSIEGEGCVLFLPGVRDLRSASRSPARCAPLFSLGSPPQAAC